MEEEKIMLTEEKKEWVKPAIKDIIPAVDTEFGREGVADSITSSS